MSDRRTVELVARLDELERIEQRRKSEHTLRDMEWLPTQKRFISAYHDPDIDTVLMTGPNQVGKSILAASMMTATCQGHQPWDGKPRRFKPPVKIALLLPDYDNHATKFFEQDLCSLLPRDHMRVKTTQQGAPRIITFPGFRNSSIHIFSSDQEMKRQEGARWHELWIDEPCERGHYVALARGLQRTQGMTCMTMTPVNEPWIAEEFYDAAHNQGGAKRNVFAITAFPDENRESLGGHLPDKAVDAFRANLTPEEREARVHGRWTHLIGRVYKSFDPNVHVIEGLPPLPNGITLDDLPHGVVVDPHDRLPFAIAWFCIYPGEDMVFYAEYPDTAFEQITSCDLDIDDYCDILDQVRHRMTWRLMDPNYGNRGAIQANGQTIAEAFAIRGYPFQTDIMDDLTAGHRAVRGRLHYDRERPLSPLNAPKLYVTQNCMNIRKSFRMYLWADHKGRTAEGKTRKEVPQEKFKHYMDLIRYPCVYPGIRYIHPQILSRLHDNTMQRQVYGRGWEHDQRGKIRKALQERRQTGHRQAVFPQPGPSRRYAI